MHNNSNINPKRSENFRPFQFPQPNMSWNMFRNQSQQIFHKLYNYSLWFDILVHLTITFTMLEQCQLLKKQKTTHKVSVLTLKWKPFLTALHSLPSNIMGVQAFDSNSMLKPSRMQTHQISSVKHVSHTLNRCTNDCFYDDENSYLSCREPHPSAPDLGPQNINVKPQNMLTQSTMQEQVGLQPLVWFPPV